MLNCKFGRYGNESDHLYTLPMLPELDPRLEAYLELCKRTVERLERDGKWPWETEDIKKRQDLVELEHNTIQHE